jgi:hypothetical protein
MKKDNILELIRNGEIGLKQQLKTPFGYKPLVYADYTASGRAIKQIEDFILQNVKPSPLLYL